MATIIPKLNLNKTPNLVENNSLVFAKNIRLDVDGTIHRDYGVFPLSLHKENDSYITDYENILNRIIKDAKLQNNDDNLAWLSNIINNLEKLVADDSKHQIIGIISDSNDFYIFIHGIYNEIIENETVEKIFDTIIKYSEKEDVFTPCNCAWTWHGGTINGHVIKNLVGETILNIGESGIDEPVLFKSINLNYSSIYDDESIYTQVPKIPITNLTYGGNFSYVIPNGVYQFFVRYEIRKDFYTDWFPASTELFVGNKNTVSTSFGSLNYTNTHRDSDNSFILKVEHLIENNKNNYKSFQIGFLLSHDEAIYARAWKHFDLNTATTINFDYKPEDSIEIEPIDLLKVTYGLYNVGNIVSFKNKLYISNYVESNFNDVRLQDFADKIDISLQTKIGGNSYNGYDIKTIDIAGKTVISGLTIDNSDKYFYGDSGIFKEICTTKSSTSTITSEEAINDILAHKDYEYPISSDKYGIRIISRFDKLSNAKNKIKETYKNYKNDTKEVIYALNFDNTNIHKCTIDGKTELNITTDNILNSVYKNRYLDADCNWVDSNNNINDKVTVILYRKVTIKETVTYNNNGGLRPSVPGDNIIDDSINNPLINNTTSTTTVTRKYDVSYPQILEFQFVAWNNYLQYDDSKFLTKYTSLIPYQKYKFYIHYVKDSGEISNGFECTKVGEIEAPYAERCLTIYPKFSNIEIPEGYHACFFSICHTKTNTATIFNIEDNGLNTSKEGSCFDINMMLIPGYKDLHIKQGSKITETPEIVKPDGTIPAAITETIIETYTGKYHYSSDPSVPKYFGADGVITFNKTDINNIDFDNEKLAYIVSDYSISESKDIQLIKCTPYLYENNLETKTIKDESNVIIGNTKVYEQFQNMNLIGYICEVTPLLRNRCIQYYSDGSSVFYKENLDVNDDGSLQLTELSKYSDADADKKISNFGLKISENRYVYSNYNLNFVTLSEEPTMSIKTYYDRPANSTTSATEKESNTTRSAIFRLLPSQLMSDVYVLPNMYKTYTRKTYSTYIENETTKFDNTIRSSILSGDENRINILAFDANDYYNIPTNRGIIVNLISVGDSILVHTKDSLFKFTGSNNLQSSNGEIQPTETQPFNTGVSEVFGSDFGFAGLQYKTDSIVTEQGYIFFDRDSRTIYMYSGRDQIVKLNESIEKLFRHRNISNIYFANDYYNNRFFISILFYDTYYEISIDSTTNKEIKTLKYNYYPVTLSFNVHKDIKSFVSLHDFHYKKAFNTKNNCYFLTNDAKDICTITKDHKGCYTKLEIESDKIFPSKKETINIPVKDYKDDTTNNTSLKNINSYDSIIDVIDNTSFETVKTLNAVNWCSNIIDSEYKNIDESDVTTLRMAEDINAEYPCKYFRVYTDTCMTELLYFKNISNNYNLTSIDSYKLPRYNQGFWTTNYFRNILNTNNKTNNYISDENSLIEGKYFVIRFIFDDEFKLETISLNYNAKL